jgi:small-conductance mechanosensitive channel
MRFIPTCALLLSLAAIPAFSQSADAPTALPADGSNSSVDYSALREGLAQKNKALLDQVNVQRSNVKKNEILLKQAQKLDASNKKLEAEQKKLELENTTLEKARQALKAEQKPVESASAAAN